MGIPESTLEIKIIDEDGTPTISGPGELLVRRKGSDPRRGFFAGYFKNKKATDEAWLGGWFHTGDLVRQESDGSIFFVDRKKNVIRRSGENIAAVEVESVLVKHPAITTAAVTAVPDALRGDEVFACLVVNEPASAQLAFSIVQWGLTQMAYYKVPGYIAFVESLPMTSTQKIQRAELKLQAADLLNNKATINACKLKKRTAT